jgi:hypothetical protein
MEIDHGLPHRFRHGPSFSSLFDFLLEYEVTMFFPFMQLRFDIVVCNFYSISSGFWLQQESTSRQPNHGIR